MIDSMINRWLSMDRRTPEDTIWIWMLTWYNNLVFKTQLKVGSLVNNLTSVGLSDHRLKNRQQISRQSTKINWSYFFFEALKSTKEMLVMIIDQCYRWTDLQMIRPSGSITLFSPGISDSELYQLPNGCRSILQLPRLSEPCSSLKPSHS